MITLYNAISSDGFIARKDGSEDFIPDEVWGDFITLCKRYDTIAMGRNTYETLQRYEPEELKLFENIPIKKMVLSRRNDIKLKDGYILTNNTHDVDNLGTNILLSSGPSLNTVFLKEKKINKVILNILPITTQEGIPQFNDVSPTLILIKENKLEGRVLCEYEVQY